MLKQILSIFFITLFVGTLIMPSVLLVIDETVDVSYLLDSSEEEEGKEKNMELEVFVVENQPNSNIFSTIDNEDNLRYTYKKYPKPHLNLIFPPPEFI